MAEMRRPNGRGLPQRGAAGGARRPAARPKPTPKWVWIGLIVLPIVLIGLVANLQMRKNAAEPEKVVTKDPNARIKELEKQLELIENENRSLQKLIRAEDPSAKGQHERLTARAEKLRDEWDSFFEPKRDANGDLPLELQSYQRTRMRINVVLEDLNKTGGF